MKKEELLLHIWDWSIAYQAGLARSDNLEHWYEGKHQKARDEIIKLFKKLESGQIE